MDGSSFWTETSDMVSSVPFPPVASWTISTISGDKISWATCQSCQAWADNMFAKMHLNLKHARINVKSYSRWNPSPLTFSPRFFPSELSLIERRRRIARNFIISSQSKTALLLTVSIPLRIEEVSWRPWINCKAAAFLLPKNEKLLLFLK